jgi:hypothetical protein
MTNHAMVKRELCGRLQLQRTGNSVAYHGNGILQQLPNHSEAVLSMRESMMKKVGIPNSIKKAIVANHEPNEEGVYQDPTNSTFSNTQKSKLSICLKIQRDAAIHWFQNGHPMKSWITNSEETLGVSEKQAEKFSRGWYNIKRQETSALWAQRQDIRKGDGISLTLRELCEKVAAAVKAKRARKAKTRTNEKYLKMSQKAT